jgi:hypothetical protein
MCSSHSLTLSLIYFSVDRISHDVKLNMLINIWWCCRLCFIGRKYCFSLCFKFWPYRDNCWDAAMWEIQWSQCKDWCTFDGLQLHNLLLLHTVTVCLYYFSCTLSLCSLCFHLWDVEVIVCDWRSRSDDVILWCYRMEALHCIALLVKAIWRQ